MFIQCWSLFIKLFLLLLLINKILCQFQCDNGFDFETNLLLNPSNFTCGQSYHNISILDRFQLDLPDFDKVFSHQEEQFNLEEQIRKQFRSGSRNLCPLPNIQCERSRYRTIEGTCNNLVNPRLGSAGHCVPRLLPPVYADGVSAVKISITGRPLPNARIVSLLLHSAPKPPSQLNSLFMVYGQFLDHDIVLTPAAQSECGEKIKCCGNQERLKIVRRFSDQIGLPRSEKDSKWCYPIRLPIDDPFYSKFGQKCMEFVRSAACLSCEWGPRYQLNKITAFIDASTIYGSTLNESQSLRMLDGSGTLKVSEDSNGRPLLADSLSPENDGCSFPARGIYCFRSGDTRVNQQPPITSIHTIWHRHHNLIARGLKDLNSHWDEERLFQEARRIVAAQVQVVTYKEWLPLVLGPVLMKHFRLNLYNSGYTLYDPSKDPSILSEFSTAAFRFGHGTIRGAFARVESNGSAVPYRLKDNFFKAYILRNGTLDSIIRGLMEEQSSATGPGVDEDVRNHVYQTSMAKFGGDLIAINIQRGRDHAIPGYTSLFKYCHSKEISDWNQLSQLMDPSQVEKYRSIYAHIDDIDLFSGGLSEYPLPNAVVGPTFACILGKQFNHLRFGDRFWFEHSGMDGAFTEAQINSLRVTSLAKIICANGDDFTIIHPRVFLPVSQSNPLTQCSHLPDIDLTLWTETRSFP